MDNYLNQNREVEIIINLLRSSFYFEIEGFKPLGINYQLSIIHW